MRKRFDAFLSWLCVTEAGGILFLCLVLLTLFLSLCILNPSVLATPNPKEETRELVKHLGSGIYVFDVRDAVAKNGIPDGWTPMLADFLEKHPELEYVDSGIAHASGGHGTINSMFVVTKKR